MKEKCDICEQKKEGCEVSGMALAKFRNLPTASRGQWMPESRTCPGCKNDHKRIDGFRNYKRRIHPR